MLFRSRNPRSAHLRPGPLSSPALTFLPSTLLSPAQARLATFLPAWRSPRLAGPQETLPSRGAPARELPAARPSTLSPHPGPRERLVGRTRAPRPSPQAAQLPLQHLPSRGGSRRGLGTLRADLLRLRAAPPSSESGSSSRGGRRGSRLPQLPGGAERASPASPAPPTCSPRGTRRPPWISSWRWCSGPRSICRRPRSSTGGESAPGAPSPAPCSANFTPPWGSPSLLSVQKLGHRAASAGGEPSSRPLYQWLPEAWRARPLRVREPRRGSPGEAARRREPPTPRLGKECWERREAGAGRLGSEGAG